MGNKHGKLEKKGKKDSKKNKTKRSASTHDILGTQNDEESGNTTSPFTRVSRENNRPGMQKYQSYAGPGRNSSSQQQSETLSDVKIYRSTLSIGPTGGRYGSLSHGMGASTGLKGRSRSIATSNYQSNGTLNRAPISYNNHVAQCRRYSHIPTSDHYPNLTDTRDSIRSSVTGLNTTYPGLSYREKTNYRVVTDDFPDTAAIKRRLTQFETQFAKCFTTMYSRLSETVQLAAVSIAVCLGPNGRHQVSLYQYLTSDEIPQDLNELQQTSRSPIREQYVLTIPESLFHGVKRIRSQRIADRRQWLTLANELVTCLAVEVADELSRIFEYQIALLGDGLPIDLLARHAVECALEYLKTGNRFLERNTLIAGVLSGAPRATDPAGSKVISVVIGEREFRWNLSHILKKCGLRKESLLFHPKSPDSTNFAPWTYHTSSESNAQVYGYRGIVLDRDQVHGYYVLIREDEVRFTQTSGWNPEDIHRRYNPFRRLIGKEVMDEYCSVTKGTQNVTLADYVSKLQGYEYSRDTIQPIYRPLGMVSGLSRGSRIGSSVSSLVSSGSVGNGRAVSRRDEEVATKLHARFPNVKQIQVTSTVLQRSSTPETNGHAQPCYPRSGSTGWRGYRSESCSVASEDVGYDRYERDVPAGFAAPRFRNSVTFTTRQDPQPQKRLYQSQRPHPSRSASSFNPVSGCNYGRNASPGSSLSYAPDTVNHRPYHQNPSSGFNQAQTVSRGSTVISNGSSNSADSGFNQSSTINHGSTMVNQGPTTNQRPTHVAREISAPLPVHHRDFLNFNTFLGMIKESETHGEGIPPGSSNGLNGHYDPVRYEARSPVSCKGGVNSDEPSKANGNTINSVYSNENNPQFGNYSYRRTALSHV